MHLFTADNYSSFTDELYYMAAGERLDLGYVDSPPSVAIVAAVTRWRLGDSLLLESFGSTKQPEWRFRAVLTEEGVQRVELVRA